MFYGNKNLKYDLHSISLMKILIINNSDKNFSRIVIYLNFHNYKIKSNETPG